MAREIFIVQAHIVDANGTFNFLAGYPKTFDSKNYDGDIEKARRRAEGEFSDCWGAMCKRDDRTIQTVTLSMSDGYQLDKKSMGAFPNDPEPQVEE
jgi:hypothetical protein